MAPVDLPDPSAALAAREAHRKRAELDRLRGTADGREAVTVEEIIAGLEGSDRGRRNAGAFLAGRWDTDSDALDEALRRVVGGLDPTNLRSSALFFVEAAMSLALRGDVAAGTAALRAVVTDDSWTAADWLAAFYLARLGDPSGYAAMVACLVDEDGFTRVMATRHLIGFVPYQGQLVGDQVVDVWSRMLERVDDSDPIVSVEVPSLLVELGGDGVASILATISSEHPDDNTRRAAEDALEQLAG